MYLRLYYILISWFNALQIHEDKWGRGYQSKCILPEPCYKVLDLNYGCPNTTSSFHFQSLLSPLPIIHSQPHITITYSQNSDPQFIFISYPTIMKSSAQPKCHFEAYEGSSYLANVELSQKTSDILNRMNYPNMKQLDFLVGNQQPSAARDILCQRNAITDEFLRQSSANKLSYLLPL